MWEKRHKASEGSVARARRLRADSSIPERLLWGGLRGGRLAGLKFRRQHPIGPYFADFHCHSAALVIELDGDSRLGRAEHDQARTAYLAERGLHVMRIANDDVILDLDSVLLGIARAAGIDADGSPIAKRPHPNPLPEGEGVQSP